MRFLTAIFRKLIKPNLRTLEEIHRANRTTRIAKRNRKS